MAAARDRPPGPAERSPSSRSVAPEEGRSPARAFEALTTAGPGGIRAGDVHALQRVLGNRVVSRMLASRPSEAVVTPEPVVQRSAAAPLHLGTRIARETASQAVRGTGGPLPYRAEIQRAFGLHDLQSVKAHTDGPAVAGARTLGAEAFAMGEHVAFAGAPSLRTAAHEAAHVVQQRAGVRPPRGMGAPGDVHEREADAIADHVVQGRSAAPLLGAYRGARAAPAPPVQFLKKGDFAQLGAIGLDVATWGEFEAALAKISSASTLSVVTNFLTTKAAETKDTELLKDIFQARQLAEQRKLALRPLSQRSSTLVDHYDALARQPVVAQQAQPVVAQQAQPVKRQPTKDAKVGFEFQMLGSDVKVTTKPEEAEEEDDDSGFGFDRGDDKKAYEVARASATVTPALQHYGRQKLWYVVADGTDLEFVTNPIQSVADLGKAMDEIVAVAATIAAAQAATTYALGEDVVAVTAAVGTGQPQVNPDILLDKLPALIADMMQNDPLRAQMFGVSGVSGTGWDVKKTDQELTEVHTASQGIQALQAAAIKQALGMDEKAPASDVDTARGMLTVLAQSVIHRAFFPTSGVPKDQPILHKTDMARTWAALAQGGLIGKNVGGDKVLELLGVAYPRLSQASTEAKAIVTNAVMKKGKDTVWSSLTTPKNVTSKGRNAKQIFIELRRVPVLPVNQWRAFALGALDYFVYNAQELFD